MKKIFCMIISAAALPLLSVAQDKAWTLQECIDYALEHNIGIQQSQNGVALQETALSTSRGSRLPAVSASVSQNYSFGRGLTADNTYSNTNTSNTSLSLGAGMTLFDGLRIRNTIELDRLNLAAATADLEKARDDIRVRTAQAYVQILYDMELLEVAGRQVTLDAHQVERLTAMVESGKASGVELAQQEAALAGSRLTETQAQNNLSLAILELTQLLELPSPEGFTIVRPEIPDDGLALLPDPEDIYAQAVSLRPSVRAEELRLEGADRSIAIAKAGLYPSLSLSGGMGSNHYTTSSYHSDSFWNQLSNNFSQYVSLSLNIPVFSRFSTRNSIRTARINRDNQKLQLESARKSLYKEIQQAYHGAVAAVSRYMASSEALRSSEAAFGQVQAKYEHGKASITEFNEARSQYLKAVSDQVQARYEYLYQSKLLDFYKGGRLDF